MTSISVETLLSKMERPAEIPPVRSDPEPRVRRYPIVSADDHYMEPADMFEGRLPAALQGRAPKVVEDEAGAQWWHYDDARLAVSGTDAVKSASSRCAGEPGTSPHASPTWTSPGSMPP
jgi:hypothetical protein